MYWRHFHNWELWCTKGSGLKERCIQHAFGQKTWWDTWLDQRPFVFWECFNLTVRWETKWKRFKKTLCFTFSWKEYHPTSWIQQCIYMHLERFLQGNHLPMTTLSKQQLRHFVFKDARNRSSEFIQGHEDIIRSFHADLNLWSFHFCSFQFNEVFEKLRFLLHASQKNLEALVRKQNRNLGFYWKKRYGVLPFSMNNTCWKHANLRCKWKVCFFAGKNFLSFLPKNSHLSFLIVLLNQLDW